MIAPFDWRSAKFTVLDASRETDILAELDAECLDDTGQLRVMPASFYASRVHEDLLVWCVRRGFYCLPTLELVEFVRSQIGSARAIEVGSGNGALGRALGIPLTDSRQQERPDVRLLYENLKQEIVPYPADVETLTALEAAEKYRPEVIVGAWVTHRYNPNKPKLEGNQSGVDEIKLFDKSFVQKYIFVGHERVHALKPILARPHATHRLPFLYSRSLDKQDAVWIWTK